MKSLCLFITFLALGVLSVQAATSRFAVIGDYGYVGPNDSAVAAMIKTWNVDFIVTVGDNSYNPGTIDNNIGKYYSSYIGAYHGAYGPGSPINRFFPSLGNHEYSDGGGLAAYLSYFTLPGAGIATSNSSGNERYYDFTIGDIQFLALNSDPPEPDGTAWNSVQGNWARWMLTNYGKNTKWKIVLMHHPPYSSGNVHGSTPAMRWPFEQWGVDVTLAGHEHNYERVMVDNDRGGDSIPYFVNGVGGRSLYGFSFTPVKGSAMRYSDSYGAMLVEAADSTMLIQLYSITGGGSGTLIDSITVRARHSCCRGKMGNVNQLDRIDLSDLSAIINYLTGGWWTLPCLEEGDIDGNGMVDVVDLGQLVAYLLGTSDLPACP
jgi:tartrate-resistant acid phosphatase type 5